MIRRILRASVPILLLAAGIAMVVYGATSRSIPVVQYVEVEETITIPPPPMGFGMDPHGPPGMGQPGMDPDMDPGMDPDMMGPGMDDPWTPQAPPTKETVIRQQREVNDELEPKVILDVTVGGLTRLVDTGEIVRTYVGKPPSLCPT
ncbi:MAG: hypothetical protein GX621_00225 [Pirellulaceae bacterium]|nr:hypothetical protein [Pirellulaceae bacterium]